MMNLPSPGPAAGAYALSQRLEQLVNGLRITYMNAGITPTGAPELSHYLKEVAGILDGLSVKGKSVPGRGKKG